MHQETSSNISKQIEEFKQKIPGIYDNNGLINFVAGDSALAHALWDSFQSSEYIKHWIFLAEKIPALAVTISRSIIFQDNLDNWPYYRLVLAKITPQACINIIMTKKISPWDLAGLKTHYKKEPLITEVINTTPALHTAMLFHEKLSNKNFAENPDIGGILALAEALNILKYDNCFTKYFHNNLLLVKKLWFDSIARQKLNLSLWNLAIIWVPEFSDVVVESDLSQWTERSIMDLACLDKNKAIKLFQNGSTKYLSGENLAKILDKYHPDNEDLIQLIENIPENKKRLENYRFELSLATEHEVDIEKLKAFFDRLKLTSSIFNDGFPIYSFLRREQHQWLIYIAWKEPLIQILLSKYYWVTLAEHNADLADTISKDLTYFDDDNYLAYSFCKINIEICKKVLENVDFVSKALSYHVNDLVVKYGLPLLKIILVNPKLLSITYNSALLTRNCVELNLEYLLGDYFKNIANKPILASECYCHAFLQGSVPAFDEVISLGSEDQLKLCLNFAEEQIKLDEKSTLYIARHKLRVRLFELTKDEMYNPAADIESPEAKAARIERKRLAAEAEAELKQERELKQKEELFIRDVCQELYEADLSGVISLFRKNFFATSKTFAEVSFEVEQNPNDKVAVCFHLALQIISAIRSNGESSIALNCYMREEWSSNASMRQLVRSKYPDFFRLVSPQGPTYRGSLFDPMHRPDVSDSINNTNEGNRFIKSI